MHRQQPAAGLPAEGFNTNVKTDRDTQPSDPTAGLLLEREIKALKLITTARFVLMILMTPMVWLFGSTRFDQLATFASLMVYMLTVCALAYFVSRRRHLRAVGLIGVGLDVVMIAVLPLIWYTALGGSAIPVGLTLKTSVTLFALLLITLNTLAMRPSYPLLVTIGALIVHLALVAGAMADQQTVFTTEYLRAYNTSEVAVGRVVTRITIIVVVGLILTLLTARARKMVIEAAQLEKTNIQLGRYFSPNLVRKLADNPALLGVGGERKDLSFVFTDLQGFTSLVENNEPDVVVPLLNEYLDELVQVAFRHEGTVDKIVGDAVHVIFSAPVTQPDHPARAIACAVEMDAVAERFRARCAPLITVGVTRIGVNSGFAIVGNFGGDALFDYTAHGDAINTAARLEGANKYLGTRICVSGQTASRAADFRGRPGGTVWLVGKNQGIEIFEPIIAANETSPLTVYLNAYDLLHREQPSALECFEALCKRYPQDSLAHFHLNRLRTGQTGTRIVFAEK